MQLIYATTARAADVSETAVLMLRSSGHAVQVWHRPPTTLVGRPDGEVIIVDAATDVQAGRQYCLALARLAVATPVVAVVPAAAVSVVTADWGVADVVVEHSSAVEFDLRVRRALTARRSRRATATRHAGETWLDTRSLTFGDTEQVVALSRTEAKVLSLFFDHPDVVVTREVLLERVWSARGFASRNVDTIICRLRRKLGRHGHRIATARGRGYSFLAGNSDSSTTGRSAA